MPPARPAAGPVSVLTTGLSLSEGFKATLINLYEQLASGTAFEGARAEVSMAPILVLRPGVVLVEEAQPLDIGVAPSLPKERTATAGAFDGELADVYRPKRLADDDECRYRTMIATRRDVAVSGCLECYLP